MGSEAVSIADLRSDEVKKCAESETELIRKNFPEEKDGFLVVPKVMEE
jgi:Asp-tRNA(Asn)/Glu-tRNA(Gln) amidotransferase C subunit